MYDNKQCILALRVRLDSCQISYLSDYLPWVPKHIVNKKSE